MSLPNLPASSEAVVKNSSAMALSFSKRSARLRSLDERLLKHPKGMTLHATKKILYRSPLASAGRPIAPAKPHRHNGRPAKARRLRHCSLSLSLAAGLTPHSAPDAAARTCTNKRPSTGGVLTVTVTSCAPLTVAPVLCSAAVSSVHVCRLVEVQIV